MVVLGAKMISTDDITRRHFVGRNHVCDYLLETVRKNPGYMKELECTVVIDAGKAGSLKEETLVFVPIEYMEHKISYGVIEYLEYTKSSLFILKDIRKVESMISSYEIREEKLQVKYNCDPDVDKREINCFMFIFNKAKLEDVRIAKPARVSEFIFGNQEYKCNKCSEITYVENTEYSCVPDLMYRLKNEKIEYFCYPCAKHISGLSHVGDFIARTVNIKQS